MTPLQALAALCSRYETAATQLAALDAERAREMAAVEARHAAQILTAQLVVEDLKTEITKLSKKQPELFPKPQRKLAFGAVEVGFRIHPACVELKRGTTEEQAVAGILTHKLLGAAYVRETIGLAKDAILAMKDYHSIVAALHSVNVRIKRKENFYIAGPELPGATD